jgi:hypothetical protein
MRTLGFTILGPCDEPPQSARRANWEVPDGG